MKRTWNISLLDKLYLGILLFIFGFIVLHAPISVFFGTIWPDYSLIIKAWKEILICVALIVLLIILIKNRAFKVLKEPILIAIGLYVLLHLLLLPLNFKNINSSVAGLMIDLRYLVYFALIFVAMRLYPESKKIFIKIGLIGAILVVIFAVLQAFILPKDILKYLGYGNSTISPYLTVDQNESFIRINSTMRGPNSLGAYVVIILPIIIAGFFKKKIFQSKKGKWLFAVSIIGLLIALWSSYSRSAFIGLGVALAILALILFSKKISKKFWIILGAILLVFGGTIFAFRDSNFVSNVIMHENLADSNDVNSNEGHLQSINTSLAKVASNVLGTGVGSTGSASLLTDSGNIIENQYLVIASEAGWLGLILFASIMIAIFLRLYDNRKDWLSLGVLASGLGIFIICLVLPILADDTISIIWFGFAALAFTKKRYN